MQPRITLTSDELSQAVAVASRRRISCLFGRQNPQHYEDKDAKEWSTEIEACCAEMAVAKHLGVYWTGGVFNGKRAESDAGHMRQVRYTPYSTGSLILYPEDNKEHRMILVTGKSPTYTIKGWILAGRGMKDEFWKDRSEVKCPSWWVPQSELNPIPCPEELKEAA